MDNENNSGKIIRTSVAELTSPLGVSIPGAGVDKGFLLEVMVGGLQEILVSFSNGRNEPLRSTLSLPGQPPETVEFEPTGSWTTYSNKVLHIDLREGMHVLTFSSLNNAGAEIASVSNLGPASGGKSGRSMLTSAALAGLNIAAVGAVALALSPSVQHANEETAQATPANPNDRPTAPRGEEVASASAVTLAGNAAQAAETTSFNDETFASPDDKADLTTGTVPAEAPTDAASSELAGAGGRDFRFLGSSRPALDTPKGDSPSDFETVAFAPSSVARSAPAFGGAGVSASNEALVSDEPAEDTHEDNTGSGPSGSETPVTVAPSENEVELPAQNEVELPAEDDVDLPAFASAPIRIQAESATFGNSGGNVTTNPVVIHKDNAATGDVLNADAADGDAYVDFAGFNNNNNIGNGQYIEWSFSVAEAGHYDIGVGYAFFSAGTSNRPMRLDVNGQLWDRVFDFKSTGANTTYAESGTRVYLQAGDNTIRLTANGFSGPNIDYLEIREADPNVIVIQAESLVSQAGSNTNGAINRPMSGTNTPSNEIFRFGAEGESYLDWAQNSAAQVS
ncbi:carbohydrate-binding protein (plasmid) [Aliirhizobium terrae]|uniref:carbohydrate-binding protein n=1 Tax=Terrirhizobium terrae TaxID=2926709 RepID=UPI0025761508|nr:carbohydrate-binding protein [Rhizobium sp. CC-CFT758]WJH38414.1 carbohydrate-binding protein [Rhizobium sp. CC-CFT758]